MKTFHCGALLAAIAFVLAPIAQAEISVSVGIAPPPLPIYTQPLVPGDGYIWTPGYWSWNGSDNDYYWVPGTWVAAPFEGALWTPGYWGWGDGGYVWHGGYWGSHIGYYGGINYGFGYTGVGYQGGYWNNGAFNYNRSVNNVGGAHVAHIYNAKVANPSGSRVSYNGGKGGAQLQPTKGDQSIAGMPHPGQTAPQSQHEQAARSNMASRASVNHGMPKVAATPEPGAFSSPNVVAARAEQARQVAKPHAAPARAEAGDRQAAAPMAHAQQPERAAPQVHQEAPRPAPRHAEEAHEK